MGLLTAFLIGFLSLAALNAGFCNGGCIERERQALLKLKQDMVDPKGRLASWVADDEDCCKWKGVVCNNVTGHVLKLNLQNPTVDYDLDDQTDQDDEASERSKLGGKISPSLLDLKHLCYLDLSNNDFGGIHIPKFLGSLRNLRILNLSRSRFTGKVPHHLGNLSNLKYLNLGWNDHLHVENFHWLSSLSSLQYLDMSWGNLSKASNWFRVINTLPSLLQLHLAACHLGPLDQVHPITNTNLSSLDVLDLSNNPGLTYSSNINWVFGLKKLIFLDLSGNNFAYSISLPYGLQNLTLLRHLDLSFSFFFKFPLSDWLDKFIHLEFLDLSYLFVNNLKGESEIPFRSIGKLCNLSYLSLSYVNLSLKLFDILEIFSKCISKSLESLHLDKCQLSGQLTNQLGNFKILRELFISGNSISGPIPTSIGELQSLKVLHLSTNKLNGSLPESFGQLANLKDVDISYNSFVGSLPESFGQLVNLKNVDISHNSFDGSLPMSFGQLANLKNVDISHNSFDGSLPMSFGQLANLKIVDISHNSFDGSLFESLGQLANLKDVDISHNSFKDTVSEIHFINLTKLKTFIAHGNPSMTLKVHSNWLPDFQLLRLMLGSWHLGPQFPQWLHSQNYLERLDISNSKISDTVPSWFWEVSAQYEYLNISHNQIHGQLPSVLNSSNFFSGIDSSTSFSVIDFSSNNFTGSLARFSSGLGSLDLSKNHLSGSLSHLLCHKINKSMAMTVLNLRENLLSGELPDCWTKWPNLNAIALADNRLTGGIPKSIGALPFLTVLNLEKNSLSGDIPLSLSNCTYLEILQLSENELDGSIPPWIGHSLANLKILKLDANKFSGQIPNELCLLDSLQILDLAHNNLFGNLPTCIGDISVLLSTDNHPQEFNLLRRPIDDDILNQLVIYLENAVVWKKGQLLEYDKTLHLVKIMDFSGNNLSGEIPPEITHLQGLQSLNLSHNLFTGRIPENIGNMRMLESADFSGNKLSGSIPESMSSLTFLSSLNLSNNQLTGRIPLGTQLQSFTASSYARNKLCGLPLPDNCSANRNSTRSIQNRGRKDRNGVEISWLFVSVALGFIVGFWSILSPLVMNRRWRCMYYQFLEEMWWKISDYVNNCF